MRKGGAESAEFLQADLSTVTEMKTAAERVLEWRPVLHGVTHSAMSALDAREFTVDGLEAAFALQYLARAVTDRMLVDALAASGDGRIVHVSRSMDESVVPDLDDLQFERSKRNFFSAVLDTRALGFLLIQEASKLWHDRWVTLAAVCVGPTRTKVMQDKRMPLFMQLQAMVGTTPKRSPANVAGFLARVSVADSDGSVLRKPTAWTPERIEWKAEDAERLWAITGRLAAEHGAEPL